MVMNKLFTADDLMELLGEGALSADRKRAKALQGRLASRLVNSAENLGFDAIIVKSVDFESVQIRANLGDAIVTITVYDDDDMVVEVPEKSAALLGVAEYSSLDSVGAVVGFLRMVRRKINAGRDKKQA
jgi:hypothetical protein